MMTIDDEGEGGVWPNDDVITEMRKSPKFIFPKIFKFRKNNSKI